MFGNSQDLDVLNRAAVVCKQFRDAIVAVQLWHDWLSMQLDSDLLPLNLSQTEIDTMRGAAADLYDLTLKFFNGGVATHPVPYDYRVNSYQCIGPE